MISLGVLVANFQINGSFSTDTYLNYSGSLGDSDLTNFTLCMWQKVNFLRGYETFSLSYSSEISDNALWVRYERTINNEKYGKQKLVQGREVSPFQLTICKHPDNVAECTSFFLGSKPLNKWHHICFSSKKTDLVNGLVKSRASLYFDGILRDSSKLE